GERSLVPETVSLATGVLRNQGAAARDNAMVWVNSSGRVAVNVTSTRADGGSQFQSFNYAPADVDSIVFHGGAGDDVFTDHTGLFTTAYGEGDDDALYGGHGLDVLDGGAGNDTPTANCQSVLYGRGGDDTFRIQADIDVGQVTVVEYNGEGSDTLDFSPTCRGVTANLGIFGAAQAVSPTASMTLAGYPQA